MRMRSRMLAWVVQAAVLAAVVLAAGAGVEALAAVAPVTAPANDDLAAAQIVRNLPATLPGTTVGATTEPLEAESDCGVSTASSVWYTLRTPVAERVGIDLAAGGMLDGTVDVYHAVRSQLQSLGCERTDSHGRASLTFSTSKNGVYEIRVAALTTSQLAPFTLEVFLPTPAVSPPGAPLPAGGRAGQVDRIQNINAAFSFTLRSGVSYLINLANKTHGGCVSGALFAPGTRSFEEASPLLHISCGGFRLFTPGPGAGGRYSFQITPRLSRLGVQRFHLQVAPANSAETAPGRPLVNYARVRGALDGGRIGVLRLYRFDVRTHSNLTLRLQAPARSNFKLQLRGLDGHVIECQCAGGGAKTLQHELRPGGYYAVVLVRGTSSGQFTLERESRTITSTAISFSASNAHAGQPLTISLAVTPASSGPATVEIERFDPVFGWQFYRQLQTAVRSGRASVAFTPPAAGRWRARASFAGSRAASPSAVGFTYLLVA